jgi:hypothetical protein
LRIGKFKNKYNAKLLAQLAKKVPIAWLQTKTTKKRVLTTYTKKIKSIFAHKTYITTYLTTIALGNTKFDILHLKPKHINRFMLQITFQSVFSQLPTDRQIPIFQTNVTIEHSCMGEFRDMGIPAQVVKKKSCTSGGVQDFLQDFFLPRVQEFPCPYIRRYRKDIPL